MLGKREAAFWQRMKTGLGRIFASNGQINRILMDRIETPNTRIGFPDVHLTDPEYGDCWIELKVAKGNRINLSPLQADWHNERSKAGSRCRIVAFVERPEGNIICVWDGRQAHQVRDLGLQVKAIDVFGEPFNWHELRLALFYDKVS